MIGNDIVDLTLAKKESNWKRPRFLDKIFTLKEQKLIGETSQPDKMVWLLWSMKESAYKLHVQVFEKRFFAPKKLECFIQNLKRDECFGVVHCVDFQCFTQSEISDHFIYSIAKLKKSKAYLSQNFELENTSIKSQHALVSKRVRTHFATCLGTAIDEIRIEKNSLGVPFLYTKKQNLKVAVSTTHHGNYGAFAFKKGFKWKNF